MNAALVRQFAEVHLVCLRQSCFVRLGDRPFGLIDWDEVPQGAGLVIQMRPHQTTEADHSDDPGAIDLLQRKSVHPWEPERLTSELVAHTHWPRPPIFPVPGAAACY